MEKIKNISFTDVTFEDGFWKSRYELNRDVSMSAVRKRFEETGRFDALRFIYKKDAGSAMPHIFYDSDVAKWIEAVGYFAMKGEDTAKEQAFIDSLVDCMEKNQLENGYLNSHFIQVEPEKIFTIRSQHELYCAGHLIEAAIAYLQGTGKRKLYDIMLKYIECIRRAFVIEKTAKFTTPGHEEIELALLKLYDFSGDRSYLDLAMFFIDERGRNDVSISEVFNNKNDQSEMPVRELTLAEGHAVRAMYLYTAMSEAALKTGDRSLYDACVRLFADTTEKKMYITGGIGSTRLGESFTVGYDLPNLQAYTESCAAIGLVLFSLSMQKHNADAGYADIIERVMYNNLLSSTSLDGKSFFYENPLEYHLASIGKETCMVPSKQTRYPITHRKEVFGCSCCPPNINRIFARIGDLFFSESDGENALIVNQYAAMKLDNGKVYLNMATDYPASGKVRISLEKCGYKKIMLRVPYWCDEVSADGAVREGNYLVYDGEKTKVIEVDFNMKPYFAEANTEVRDDNGRVALCYGPTVYILERIDNPYPLNALSVDIDCEVKAVESEGYFLPHLECEGFIDGAFGALYRKATHEKHRVKLHFRPYFTYANREECDALIWVRGIK